MVRFPSIHLWILSCSLAPWAVAWAGSVDAGREKSAVCSACHGADGNSAAAIYPHLAGQHAAYLETQLRAYRDGQRKNAQMSALVQSLSDEDIADLAAYYQAQEPRAGAASEGLVEQGKRVYRVGNARTGVPACMACHGPAGVGNPLAGYPRVSGQQAAYSEAQLRAYRAGERIHPVMQDIAARLSDEELRAVADYMQGLYGTTP